jgi:hypothetical protein
MFNAFNEQQRYDLVSGHQDFLSLILLQKRDKLSNNLCRVLRHPYACFKCSPHVWSWIAFSQWTVVPPRPLVLVSVVAPWSMRRASLIGFY